MPWTAALRPSSICATSCRIDIDRQSLQTGTFIGRRESAEDAREASYAMIQGMSRSADRFSGSWPLHTGVSVSQYDGTSITSLEQLRGRACKQ